MLTRIVTLAAALAFVVLPARADDITAGSLKISSPWARATPKGASVGGGYLTITNTGNAPDRLTGGASDISKRFELHEMSLDKGVMKMRFLPQGVEIKPGETVEFKPGGHHIMFVGLNKQLMQGEQIKATLNFEKAGNVEVTFAVQGIGARSGSSHSGH